MRLLRVHDVVPLEDALDDDYLTLPFDSNDEVSLADCFVLGLLKLRPESNLRLVDFTKFEKGTRVRLHTHARTHARTHTHTHTFNGPFSGTTQVSRYQKSKTNLHFTEARDSEWQWHQLGDMQVCTSLQTDNHTSTQPLSFYRPVALPAAQPTVSKH